MSIELFLDQGTNLSAVLIQDSGSPAARGVTHALARLTADRSLYPVRTATPNRLSRRTGVAPPAKPFGWRTTL
ncbi:hypothetical protein GCM10027615_65210 [Plantactinospora veratri]